MTDTERLKKEIENRGIKLAFVAEKLGLSRQAFQKRFRDKTEFKASEMFIVSDILNLTDDEQREIFCFQGNQLDNES